MKLQAESSARLKPSRRGVPLTELPVIRSWAASQRGGSIELQASLARCRAFLEALAQLLPGLTAALGRDEAGGAWSPT